MHSGDPTGTFDFESQHLLDYIQDNLRLQRNLAGFMGSRSENEVGLVSSPPHARYPRYPIRSQHMQ
jgi:hypothetical protein